MAGKRLQAANAKKSLFLSAMKKTIAVIYSLAVISAVYACDDDPTHIHRRAPAIITPPSRQLDWGDINIIHTTDTHGWLLGHQKTSSPEPNYSGTFGDFSSFVSHMKDIADKKGVDLLLVDSGDLHDGTGLTDGFPPGGIDAHDSNEFFAKLPYDVLTIGNHELYVYNNTLDIYNNFIPKFNGRYLSSNANITLPGTSGTVPIGNRWAKFKTQKGRNVTALGVLFDFTGNDKGTSVQKVEDLVKEPWFLEVIKEEPALFLLAGHMPVQKDKWPVVFNAIRAVHPLTPIVILGDAHSNFLIIIHSHLGSGHSHIRDCTQLDGRSMSLQSGRYMETVGWLSAKLDDNKANKNITFTRRYLDPNRVTYEYHTNLTETDFDTSIGKSITTGLLALAKKFNLDFIYGTAPRDYTLNQDPYPSEGSALTLFIEDAVPYALALSNPRNNTPNFIIANSGSQRFDVYSGPFSKNDLLTASPYADPFFYIPSVPLSQAKQVLADLNKPSTANDLSDYGNGASPVKAADSNDTLGYVTHDSCPGDGDDTVHKALAQYNLPHYISSKPPNVSEQTPIDLVFINFIEPRVIASLNSIQKVKVYSSADAHQYSPVVLNQALGYYAIGHWNKD
ncbi:hypothetical protein D9615_009216 [Tricholomella constricta]|uniref:Putative 5'-nucleotidase C-terminal domain-containing protein n=1 Tax=Tricholomella constricta TaxID=117010 RepID=A0A8H5H2P4_9AGAR|nr:hypothetical protein D9615_009216 [Tricholomella constricta]